MHAVIMAGGRGTRLAPYTTVLPKPLMPLGDRPILDVLLRQLVRDGADGITISLSPLSGLIESWVAHQGDYGVEIGFVYEDTPLGTAGALRSVRRPASTFLALNGDILTTLDFGDLIAHNRETGAIATIATKRRSVDVEYGIVHTHEDGRVDRLEEKPRLEFIVSMGVYAMEPELIELIAPGERIDFPDLISRAVQDGHDCADAPVLRLLARHRESFRLRGGDRGVRVSPSRLPRSTVAVAGGASAATRRSLGSMLREPQIRREAGRYVIVGIVGYLVQLASFALLANGIGLQYLVAGAAAGLLALANNFVLNRYWTFAATRGRVVRQATRYSIVSAVFFAAQFAVLYLLVALGSGKVLAEALAVAVIVPANFLVQRRIVFRD